MHLHKRLLPVHSMATRSSMFVKALFLLVLLSVFPALAAKISEKASVIAIATNNEAKPYQLVVESFKSALLEKYPNIEFIQYSGDNKVAVPPDMIFALGSSLVKKSISEFSSRQLLATMILSEEVLEKSTHATAILLKTSIQKQLEWHKRILPSAKRIGILFDPQHNQDWVDNAEKQAAKMGLEIIAVPVESPKDLPTALKIVGNTADSILGIADKTVYSGKTAKAVLLFSFRQRIPFVGLSSAWVKAGALYALDWDYPALGRQSASIASKILSGTHAKKIKPQLADNPAFQINIKTAKHMKLIISQELIDRAAKVYD